MALQPVNVSVADVEVLSGCVEQGNLTMEVTDYNISCTNSSVVPRPGPRVKEMDSFRILLYVLIFLLSVVGNLLIILVLMLNKRMRTVTNCFLLSLALSDLMMAIFCMPFTLIPNILNDFIFGGTMCKAISYLMGISVSISTFSLVAIAFERYSAICNPLKSRSWQTKSHAYRVITATWALSLLIMVPYPVFSVIVTFPKGNGTVRNGTVSNATVVNMCRLDWPSKEAEQTWYVLLLFVLFFIPGVVMMIAYGMISRELFRGMQFESNETAGQKNGAAKPLTANDDDDGCYAQVAKKPNSAVELPTLSASAAATQAKTERARSNTSDAKLQAKRRVIRMLMVIVALFFICWMPLYSANTWKAFDLRSASRALSGAPISFIHLLSYSSACVNPIIYCFMNTRFRKALIATFACCCRNRFCRHCLWCRKREAGEDGTTAVSMATSMATSVSKISYTTVGNTGNC
ncbi:cholecystokinin receptor-like [Notolabrus celidotus]|uniref:cholecystokinin receptor-like n=1 Tax=Notolabrus celidotus TaxID=1203425 RepID=UPI00148F4F16|nr:cholecystokinin receptor-like [Notolabrus celidotus]